MSQKGRSFNSRKTMSDILQNIDLLPERPVLIAGPTASGKSALALTIARAQGRMVVNADALQIWDCWRVLTARPSPEDEATAPHRLYGHVPQGQDYSVGAWLAEVAPILARPGPAPVIVGGTGLYFNALTKGLAVIPPTPPEVRRKGDDWLADGGLAEMIAALDEQTRARIDTQNPVRVQRAWEVLTATGRGLADWQAETPPPLLTDTDATSLVLTADRDWLAERIARRFDAMLAQGALEETRRNLPHWQPQAQWARAIGAPELIAYLNGDLSLDEARERATIATRQYAKSQRIWFRGKMRHWQPIAAETLAET